MRRIFTVCAFVGILSALALAEDLSGQLQDATCYQQAKGAKPCAPSSATSSFVLVTGGKAYTLDSAGNSKATQALKSRADRSASPDAAPAAVMAKVSGTVAGDSIKVDSIDLQ